VGGPFSPLRHLGILRRDALFLILGVSWCALAVKNNRLGLLAFLISGKQKIKLPFLPLTCTFT
jgi:hypothetical protein